MNSDIRIEIGFTRHRKTLRLKRLLGADAVLALVELWCYAAIHFPRGDMSELTDEELADAAGWKDSKPGEFADALREVRFVDPPRRLHNWKSRQGYVCRAPERSAAARVGANAMWNKRRASMRAAAKSHSDPHARRNAPSPAPSPSPTPDQDLPTTDPDQGDPGGPAPATDRPAGPPRASTADAPRAREDSHGFTSTAKIAQRLQEPTEDERLEDRRRWREGVEAMKATLAAEGKPFDKPGDAARRTRGR